MLKISLREAWSLLDPVTRLNLALKDRYHVLRELGVGGTATVYLADDLKHRRKVAVKVLHPELIAAVGPQRFLREIETTAGMRHPHVLPLYDSGDADGHLYYVMPVATQESLRDRLARDGALPVSPRGRAPCALRAKRRFVDSSPGRRTR